MNSHTLNSFQKALSWLLPHPLRVITINGSDSPMECISLIIRQSNDSLIPGLQNGCCITVWNSINLFIRIHQSSWMTGVLSMSSNIVKGIFFSEEVVLDNGLKIFSKWYCQHMYYHPGLLSHLQRVGRVDLACSLRAPGFWNGKWAWALTYCYQLP